MLTSVVLETSTPMTLDIESVDPNNILVLKSVSGLSSAKTNLQTGDFARDGGYYQGRRSDKRNPVFNFKLNPSYTENIDASDIRELLHRMFFEPQADTDAVQVRLVDDKKPDKYIIGYTETVDADHFEKDLTAAVSMLCMDPYIRAVAETAGQNLSGWLKLPLKYAGSADIGLKVTMRVIYPTSQITFDNNGVSMTLVHPFKAGDAIEISTSVGDQYIRINGQDSMTAMTATSKWVQMLSSTNIWKAYGLVEGDGRVVITHYLYRAAWWGI